ncbi:transposase, partial [Blautia wexlerae]|uniref:transposase n=1 Tax=Blautia wexlerae TaxID=418240 RepID=UPI0034A42AA7
KQNGGRRIARKLRDWYPGAIYHIMHRGVRRKPIFEDEMDHQVLLQIIKTSLSKYNCWLHAYCLMTNHVHLLLETGDIDEYSCAVGSSAIIRFGSFSMIRYIV